MTNQTFTPLHCTQSRRGILRRLWGYAPILGPKAMPELFALFFLFLGKGLYAQDSEMRTIPSGFWKPLYSTDSSAFPVHPFQLDIYPVTNAQFLEFVKVNPAWQKGNVKALFADAGYLKHWNSSADIGNAELNAPVVNVSWFAARKYCECQGKRLPTVAEWELAAQASETKANATQDPTFNRRILDWYSKPTSKELPKVGSFFRNFFGIWDMHGLVWEWTLDFNSALSSGESRSDTSLDTGLFCGGGSVNANNLSNYAAFMRYAMRASLKADYTIANQGFRCAKDFPKGKYAPH